MPFKLTILGCDSAIPTVDKQQTAQLLNINERFFLIDCGENTQVQLRKYQLSFQRISHILISHLVLVIILFKQKCILNIVTIWWCFKMQEVRIEA